MQNVKYAELIRTY